MNKSQLKKTISALLLMNISGCSFLDDDEHIRKIQNPPEVRPFKEIELNYKHEANPDRFPFTGGAAIDIDGDGKMEVFISGSKDQVNGIFSYQDGKMVNITAQTMLHAEDTYGATAVDIDNDGDTDLLLAQYNDVWIYLNNRGKFTGKKLNLSLPKDSFPTNIALTDLNNDGLIDLYVSIFVTANRFVAATFHDPDHAKHNIMLLNKGNNLFEDVTQVTGTAGLQNTFHSSFVDLDNNGYQDLVLANNTGQIEIYKNSGNLKFEKLNFNSGLGFWMGLGIGDIDNDGDQDLFFSNTGSTVPVDLLRGDLKDVEQVNSEWLLLKNEGNWHFSDATKEYSLDGYGFGWGGVFEDINLDGQLDLLVAQNYVNWPAHKLNKLSNKAFLQLDNKGEMGFYHLDSLNLNNPYYGQTTLITDLDNDGKPDVVWLNMNGPVRAFLNQSNNNFIKVAVPDNVKYLNALLWIEYANGGKSYTKQIVTNTGMSTDQTPDIFFGLGKETSVKALNIKTNDGNVKIINAPVLNQTINLQ